VGLLNELGARGGGRRESGAFLLVPRTGRPTVTRIVYFDDLDPHCLTGGISIDGSAYPGLWQICREQGLRVAGDVHTHPRGWVGQSQTDQDNPMVATLGHLALIVPYFAQRGCRLGQLGVHEYLGDAGWQEHSNGAASQVVYIGWMA
jgi:proteasome lid subunit RPN8/RPN11